MKISELRFDDKGLVPATVQDEETGDVLIVGFMNEDALRKTFETGLVTFWSRTKQALWTKGDTSGNRLRLVRIFYNCEESTLLVKVNLEGTAACHTGNRSCFFRELEP